MSYCDTSVKCYMNDLYIYVLCSHLSIYLSIVLWLYCVFLSQRYTLYVVENVYIPGVVM